MYKLLFDPNLILTATKSERDAVRGMNIDRKNAMTKSGAIALLIQIVQEQQQAIEELQFKVAELRGEVEP